MRKVTEQIATAFLNSEKKTVGNTSTDGENIYLHGNKIVSKNRFDNGMVNNFLFTLHSWNTPTTRERLNGVLEKMGSSIRFRQKDYSPIITGISDKGELVSKEIHSSNTYSISALYILLNEVQSEAQKVFKTHVSNLPFV